jgi:hypothetical protein
VSSLLRRLLPAAPALLLAGSAAAATPQTFDTDPVLSSVQAPGTWYTDRYAPGVFDSEPFDGDARLRHGIRMTERAAARPPAYSSSFYNTQGRKYDVNASGSVQRFSIEMYVADDFTSEDRSAGLWATGFDAGNAVSAYPILAFRHSQDSPIWGASTVAAGFYGWDYVTGGYPFFMPVTETGRWYTLSFELNVGVGTTYYVDGTMLGFIADPDTTSLGNVILNAYNYGDEDYDVYWDDFLAGRQSVGIDVRPNNEQNQVNTTARQLVPIAVLGSESFDATELEIESVTVRAASPLATKTETGDVNGDGFVDVTLYFRARDIGAPSSGECADPDATLLLEGFTTSGKAIEGTDHVSWLGC